jgi:hypothetical protein
LKCVGFGGSCRCWARDKISLSVSIVVLSGAVRSSRGGETFSATFLTRRGATAGGGAASSARRTDGHPKPCPTAKKLASLTDGESGGSPPSRSTDLFDHFCCQLEKIIDFANVRQKNICAFSKFSFVAFEDQK